MYPLHAIPCKPTTAFAKPFFFHFSRFHPSCRRFPSSGHSNMSLSCNTIWLGLRGFTSFSPRVGYVTYFFRLRSRRRTIFQTVSYTSGHTRFSTSLQIATVISFLLPSCWNCVFSVPFSVSLQLVPSHLPRYCWHSLVCSATESPGVVIYTDRILACAFIPEHCVNYRNKWLSVSL